MNQNPPVYHEIVLFNDTSIENRHSETQQVNPARLRICRVSNLYAYIELTLLLLIAIHICKRVKRYISRQIIFFTAENGK